MKYIYDAFISYRHLPADMAVAEKLQALLESRKKKDGTKLTVFRDRSDLPTTSDLGADIRHALEQSRFLIIICSRAYQESKWCMTELEYFHQLHGGNTHILPILLEGEPEEAFPDILRYGNKTVWDAQGNPSVVRVEAEPLGADVRADTNAARLKKLRVEYLRIAAPILGVTFDQLYQRAQRKKRAVTAAVIAALTAFAVYSIILITQITQRQKQLEAKQQELYEDQSVRLANEALDLAADNAPLAMLLADAALPEDLSIPDYPVAEEAELSVRSVALQHQIDEASAFFSLNASISFDNAEWSLDRFQADGRYVVLFDFIQTYLYDSYTGQLIATLTGDDYYFFDGINRCAKEYQSTDENGKIYREYVIYDTFSAAELCRIEVDESIDCVGYDPNSGKLYLASYDNETGVYYAAGWIDTDNQYITTDPLPIGKEVDMEPTIRSRYPSGQTSDFSYLASGHYLAHAKDMPDICCYALDSFVQEYGGQYEPEGIFLTDDYKLCLIQAYDDVGNPLAAIWALEENRLLLLSEDQWLIEPHTSLLYRITENRLEIWEAHPENYPLVEPAPKFDFVSNNGNYGFIRIYDNTSGTSVVRLLVYDLSASGSFPLHHAEAEPYSLSIDLQNSYYCITPDGTRVAYITEDNLIQVMDVPNSEVVFSTPVPDPYVNDITINPNGSRVVSTSWADDTFTFHTFDLDSGLEISSTTLSAAILPYPDLTLLPYSECTDKWFMLDILGQSVVYDIDHLEDDPWIIPTSNPLLFPEWEWDSPFSFTEDNLLILPCKGYHITHYSSQIKHIYDLQSREEISFYTDIDSVREDYYYDNISKNLIIRNANSFHVQRRGESGDFEVVYTITPRHANMELVTAGHASDGTWLVLQNEEYCEIYRLEDGVLCYMIRKPDNRDSQMAVINGQLYDFCIGWHRSIPLLTTEDARKYVRNALTYDDVRRTLTDQEMRDYYIPSQWQYKSN